VLGVSFWRSSAPRKDRLKPGWISWHFVMLLAAAGIMLLLVHVTNLLGLHTGGRQF
jgi:hypothetical protein